MLLVLYFMLGMLVFILWFDFGFSFYILGSFVLWMLGGCLLFFIIWWFGYVLWIGLGLLVLMLVLLMLLCFVG